MRTLNQIFNDLKKKHKKDFFGISQTELLSECVEELRSEYIDDKINKARSILDPSYKRRDTMTKIILDAEKLKTRPIFEANKFKDK